MPRTANSDEDALTTLTWRASPKPVSTRSLPIGRSSGPEASLRRVLGDDPKQPTHIATVPRLGYRTVATVGSWAVGGSVHRTGGTIPTGFGQRKFDAGEEPGDERYPEDWSTPQSQSQVGRRRGAVLSPSLLPSCFTERTQRTITQPRPPLLRAQRDLSRCCRFST
jgi:hypothetical protein